MSIANVLLIIILVILNGFFVAVEFAVVASRRSRLDLLASADSPSLAIVRGWLDNTGSRDRVIAATQLGITLVSLALGAVGENTFEALLEPLFEHIEPPASLAFLETILPALPLVISLTVVTSLHVVLGEQVPKVAVLRGPERFALTVAPIIRVFSAIFKWFIDLLDWATRIILTIAGLPAGSSHTSVYTVDEIRQMVTGPDVEGVIEQQEREMLSAVFDFGDLVVRQVSIPRTEIISAEEYTPINDILNLSLENGITKIPIYRGSLDEVVGMVHLRDLIKAVQAGDGDDPGSTISREVLFVPETISVNDLLVQFRARHSHIAIVLDEFGGTSGLVTLEDLLEEIIGDVQDPFDTDLPSIQLLPDGSALVDGMTMIEEINDHLGLSLVDPYYDTIAGYVLGKLGRIPSTGDLVDDRDNSIRLSVEKMDRLRIERVHITRL